MPISVSLNRRLGILLPSRDCDGDPLDEEVKKEILEHTRTWFRENFSGKGEKSQTRILEHPWLEGEYDPDGEFIQEEIVEVYSFCTEEEFQQTFNSLVKLAEWVKKRANQDSVAILDDRGMHLVE